MSADSPRLARFIAGSVGIASTALTGVLYAVSILVAPSPWPVVLIGAWVMFVVVAVVLALTRPLAALIVPIVSLLVIVVALFVGQRMLGWTA